MSLAIETLGGACSILLAKLRLIGIPPAEASAPIRLYINSPGGVVTSSLPRGAGRRQSARRHASARARNHQGSRDAHGLADEAAAMRLMREEEKLARDVYLTLDCGVYAMSVATEAFAAVKRSGKGKLSSEIFVLPAHVIMVLFQETAGDFYVVSNDEVSGPFKERRPKWATCGGRLAGHSQE